MFRHVTVIEFQICCCLPYFIKLLLKLLTIIKNGYLSAIVRIVLFCTIFKLFDVE